MNWIFFYEFNIEIIIKYFQTNLTLIITEHESASLKCYFGNWYIMLHVSEFLRIIYMNILFSFAFFIM